MTSFIAVAGTIVTLLAIIRAADHAVEWLVSDNITAPRVVSWQKGPPSPIVAGTCAPVRSRVHIRKGCSGHWTARLTGTPDGAATPIERTIDSGATTWGKDGVAGWQVRSYCYAIPPNIPPGDYELWWSGEYSCPDASQVLRFSSRDASASVRIIAPIKTGGPVLPTRNPYRIRNPPT